MSDKITDKKKIAFLEAAIIKEVALEESLRMSETNDCAVIAFSVACELSYSKVHTLLKAHGRRDRDGTAYSTRTRAMVYLSLNKGYRFIGKEVPRQPNGSAHTVRSIPNAFPEGRYLVFVRGHVLPMINGEVLDFTSGRKHRVKEVIEVKLPPVAMK